MIIKGKFNKAKVFTDVIENEAIEQIKAACDFPAFKGLKIRIMPDVHAGAGCTIGTTMTIKDKIVPNMVGVDIGCGMEVTKLEDKKLNLKALDEFIHLNIPSGMTCRTKPHPFVQQINLKDLRCFSHIKDTLARNSIGTLGGGNHFIEVDKDDENYYLVIHSGSRHLGLEVASFYQKEAYKNLCGNSQKQIQKIIAYLKEEGRQKEIQSAVRMLKADKVDVSPDMAYVSGELFNDYIHDMKIVQRYAVINRNAMAHDIIEGLNLTVLERFTTVHNYIDTERMILRKGAVSARKGEKLLIPINMKDGSLICIGKGNADWNESAPHGAGRLMSRNAAFKNLTMKQFKAEMEGIYSTSITPETLDESPMAYKRLEDIVNNITPTVEIIKQIKPVYNFKAAEQINWKNAKNRT